MSHSHQPDPRRRICRLPRVAGPAGQRAETRDRSRDLVGRPADQESASAAPLARWPPRASRDTRSQGAAARSTRPAGVFSRGLSSARERRGKPAVVRLRASAPGSAARPPRPEERKKSISIRTSARPLGWLPSPGPRVGARRRSSIRQDTLQDEGANALLKTWRSPARTGHRPNRDAAGALPPTVRSAAAVSFGSLSDDEVAEVLRRNRWPPRRHGRTAALAGAARQPSNGDREGLARRLRMRARPARRLVAGSAARPWPLPRLRAGAVASGALMSLRGSSAVRRLADRQRLGDRDWTRRGCATLLAQLGTGSLGRLLAGASRPSAAQKGPATEPESSHA